MLQRRNFRYAAMFCHKQWEAVNDALGKLVGIYPEPKNVQGLGYYDAHGLCWLLNSNN